MACRAARAPPPPNRALPANPPPPPPPHLQARPDVATCLVTGNLEPIGWGKMRALGIEHLFTQPRFGGFGSDHCRWALRGRGSGAAEAGGERPAGTRIGFVRGPQRLAPGAGCGQMLGRPRASPRPWPTPRRLLPLPAATWTRCGGTARSLWRSRRGAAPSRCQVELGGSTGGQGHKGGAPAPALLVLASLVDARPPALTPACAPAYGHRPRPSSPEDATIARRWHVGDTVMDVRAAVEAGAGALGVATGNCPAEKLEAARRGPGEEVVVLPSLEDTGAVLQALGLE
jgi:hypothetical protein